MQIHLAQHNTNQPKVEPMDQGRRTTENKPAQPNQVDPAWPKAAQSWTDGPCRAKMNKDISENR